MGARDSNMGTLGMSRLGCYAQLANVLGRKNSSQAEQTDSAGTQEECGDSQGCAPTHLRSRPGLSRGYSHRLVPRRAEFLLSSKNTTRWLNKHWGSCEIKQQHKRPGQGRPEALIPAACSEGAATAFPKSSYNSRPRSAPGHRPMLRAEGSE